MKTVTAIGGPPGWEYRTGRIVFALYVLSSPLKVVFWVDRWSTGQRHRPNRKAFNVGEVRADGQAMTDVDAVRLLASEHNLEFVDLELYNVDPTVSSVVPRKVASRYGVVPIGRKFGAPVIAIGDPGDLVALDTLRATIGREFISVVAPSEQIAQCIDRVYPARSPSGAKGQPAHGVVPGAGATAHRPPDASPVGPANGHPLQAPDPVLAALGDALDATGKLVKGINGTNPDGSMAGLIPPPAGSASTGRPPPPALGGFLAPGTVPPPPVPMRPPTANLGDGGTDIAVNGRSSPGAAPGGVLATDPLGAGSTSAGSTSAGSTSAGSTSAGSTSAGSTSAGSKVAGVGEAVAADGAGVVPDALVGLELSTDTAGAGRLPSDGVAGDVPGEVGTAVDAADLVDEAVARFETTVGAPVAPVDLEGDLSGFPPLARALVEGGRVPIEAMRHALFEQERTGQSLARTLTSLQLVTEADLMWGMAHEMGLEFVDLDLAGVDLTAAYVLPESTARYHGVLVIGRRDNVPVVATANPTNVLAGDDLRTIVGRQFIMVVATRTQINAFIDRAYNQGGNAAEMATTAAGEFAQDTGSEDIENLQAVVDEAPIVRYVNLLVLQALNERASDIHVEPTAENLRIRYRIDGVLHDMSTAPRSIAAAVTTRLKVMADMNIAEHRIPQDGRISLKVGSRGIDLRMATLPTIYGEKIVMRVLDKSNVVLGFEELGFDSEMLEQYQSIYTKPYGTILVTGPTGSGKTTTLYATLSALNSPEKNIITVEDPVELRIKGINQVQLNVKAGLTFASALRSILRADPDIVLVGEIRDRETALISVEAALTGHLVLATLHTNDAASTPMRLVEMGLEPYLVSSAATAVLAQRLARRLCQHCKEAFEPTEAEVSAAGWTADELFASHDNPTLYRAVGCSACAHTGYRGRKALVELLIVTEEVEHMIIEGGSADDIHRLAIAQGMVPLRASGLHRALEGETTLEEVLRVVA